MYDALGRLLEAAAAVSDAGPDPDPQLRSNLAAAKLEYENCYEAFMLGLNVAGRRTRESIQPPKRS
ncbi:MAG TPA: hypothetical protein VG755_39725 [Nannocystaceae bacterium]|nr:hypothetical protein [Nannocystaceae bacterium]